MAVRKRSTVKAGQSKASQKRKSSMRRPGVDPATRMRLRSASKNRKPSRRKKTGRLIRRKSITRVTLRPDWFARMSPEAQKKYLAAHPNSKLKASKKRAKSKVVARRKRA